MQDNTIDLYEEITPALTDEVLVVRLDETTGKATSGGYYSVTDLLTLIAPNLYFSVEDSDVDTYKQLTSISDSSETVITSTATNEETLAATYLATAQIDVTTIPSSTWKFILQAKVDDTDSISKYKIEVFVRSTDGTETTLFSEYSEEIDSTDYTQYILTTTEGEYSVNLTDHIGVRVYVYTDSTNTITFSTKIGGETPSYLDPPSFPFSHTQLTGLNNDTEYQHLTATEKAKIGTNESNIETLDTNKADVTYVDEKIANYNTQDFTATAGQTTFLADYTVGYTDVYRNGLKLSTDAFTATNGTSIILAEQAYADDIISIQSLKAEFLVADTYTQAQVDNMIAIKDEEIADLQAQIDGKVYGIQIDHSTGDVERTGNAVGMSFGSPDGTQAITSDFDNVFPYSDIYTLKIDSEGVKKYQSEDDYSTFDGSMYAHIPSFYIRDITIGDIRNISVSDKALSGYTKIDERYVGCFHAGYEDGELISKVEKAVKVNTSYTGFHNILDTQDGVYMYDMTTFHAIVALSYIEMGSLDHKTALGLGIQSGMPYGSSGYDIKVATTDANTVTVDSSKSFYTGMMVQVGTSYTSNSIASDRFITDIVDNGDGTQTLTLDGDSFSVSVGNTCVTWAQPVSQEAVDAIGDGSGYYLQFGSESRSHVAYRGIWDLHGNAWQLVAGFMRYNGEYYGCTDYTKMNVTTPVDADGWSDLGIGGYADNGYQQIRKAVEIDGGYIDVPIEWGNVASSNTFYSAYLYNFSSTYTGVRVLLLGGYWNDGSYVSPVYLYGSNAHFSAGISTGSRVIRYN